MVWPSTRISQFGKMRSAPSIHPRYQSGWAGEDTVSARYGPYSQIGLICRRPPARESTEKIPKNSPIDFAV